MAVMLHYLHCRSFDSAQQKSLSPAFFNARVGRYNALRRAYSSVG